MTNDYAKLLYKGIEQCRHVISESLSKLIDSASGGSKLNANSVHFCDYLNISSCAATETNKSYVVALYNPLGHQVQHTLRLPAHSTHFYTVKSENKDISASLVEIPEGVKKIPGRKSSATHELTFRASIPPLGFSLYQVQVEKTKSASSAHEASKVKVAKETRLKAKDFTVVLDPQGQLSKIDLGGGHVMPFKNNFALYHGAVGDNRAWERRSSGAYVFRPVNSKTYSVANLTESKLFVDEKCGVDRKSVV